MQHMHCMEYTGFYKCLSEKNRLRILNLLSVGPLCVCHFSDILDLDQVTISKQLKYLKKYRLVEGERVAQWVVYRLTEPDNPLLRVNLEELRLDSQLNVAFETDLERRQETLTRIKDQPDSCVKVIFETDQSVEPQAV